MDILRKEALELKKLLTAEIGNRYSVNQFDSAYSVPNGELVSVGSKTAKFKNIKSGATMTVPHWRAELMIWGI